MMGNPFYRFSSFHSKLPNRMMGFFLNPFHDSFCKSVNRMLPSITGQSLNQTNSEKGGNHRLKRTHTFLCHSGHQKDFTHQLYLDILAQYRHAFIDIESMPRAEPFAQFIFKEVEKCSLAVLVLSEEFFSSSIWPMLELQAFLHAKSSGVNLGLKLLPLFFKITVEDMKNPENQKRWLRIWQKWAETDDRVNVKEYRKALLVLKSHSGLVFQQGMGEVQCRRLIVEAICEIVPPSFSADLTHVQGAERICQEMINKIDQLPLKETRLALDTRIMAAYGGLGLGKTTLCKVMCNYFRKKFGWSVCHLEVGDALDLLNLQKTVLKHLTGARQSLLQSIANYHEGQNLLMNGIKGKRVFLAIDNDSTTESSIHITRMFLRLGLGKESLVLVVACSHEDLLEMIGYDIDRAIPNCSFKSLPDFEQNIIIYCTSFCMINYVTQSNSDPKKDEIVKYYHPPSLIKMGAALGGNSENWVRNLELLLKFSELNSVETINNPFLKEQRYDLKELKLPRHADCLYGDSVLTVYNGRHVPGDPHQLLGIFSGIKWDFERERNFYFIKERFLSLSPINRKHNNSHKQNPQAVLPSSNAYRESSSNFRKYISRIWELIRKTLNNI